jgi:hypothetical protein
MLNLGTGLVKILPRAFVFTLIHICMYFSLLGFLLVPIEAQSSALLLLQSHIYVCIEFILILLIVLLTLCMYVVSTNNASFCAIHIDINIDTENNTC